MISLFKIMKLPSKNNYIFLIVLTFLLLMISHPKAFSKDKKNIPSNVIASIDGRQITIDEINNLIGLLPEELQPRYLNKNLKRDFIKDYLNTEMLYVEGKKKGLDKDSEFLLRMKSIERALLRDLYIKKYVASGFSVSEGEIAEYYNKNKESFKNTDYAFVSHILVNSGDEAENIKRQITEGKTSFIDAVEKYSIDKKSSAKGGKLGMIYKGRDITGYSGSTDMVNEIFKMKKNEIGGPFKTEKGVHIIKLWNIRRGKLLSLDEVKGKIAIALNKEKMIKSIEDEIAKLSNKHDMKIYKENFSK